MDYAKLYNRYGRRLIFTSMVLLAAIFLIEIFLQQKEADLLQAGMMLPEKGLCFLLSGGSLLLSGIFVIMMYIAERKGWEKIYNVLPVISLLIFCTVVAVLFRELPVVYTIFSLAVIATVVYGSETMEWLVFLCSFGLEFCFLWKNIHDGRATFMILNSGLSIIILSISHLVCSYIIVTEAEKAKLQENTKNMETHFLIKSYTDALTGLPNVEALKKRGEKWLNKRGSYYVMIDLDKFKHVNDTYGHEFGNVVLKRLADLLYDYKNENLFVGRYGGEEFSIIFHGYSLNHAVEVLNMIRKDFNYFAYKDIPEQFSFSAGIAPLEEDVLSSIKAADEKLYQAKTSGRNRVCS